MHGSSIVNKGERGSVGKKMVMCVADRGKKTKKWEFMKPHIPLSITIFHSVCSPHRPPMTNCPAHFDQLCFYVKCVKNNYFSWGVVCTDTMDTKKNKH